MCERTYSLTHSLTHSHTHSCTRCPHTDTPASRPEEWNRLISIFSATEFADQLQRGHEDTSKVMETLIGWVGFVGCVHVRRGVVQMHAAVVRSHLCQSGHVAEAFALYNDFHSVCRGVRQMSLMLRTNSLCVIAIAQADSPAQATDDTLCSLVRSVCITPWVDVKPHVTANSATELLADLALSVTDPEVFGHACAS